MSMRYTGEVIASPDGTLCNVLDPGSVDFTGAALGRKSAQTLVRCAAGGEILNTTNKDGQIESTYIAQPGDAIFINLHNLSDVYVPADKDGTRWRFGELKRRGYEIVGDDYENGGVRIKSTATSPVLREAITIPTCIKDAWGPGQHQFLFAGATLKDNGGGRVTGIDKDAFDKTWEIVMPAAAAAPASAAVPPPGPANK